MNWYATEVVECARPTDEKKSAEVDENALPVFCERKYEAEVEENAKPTDEKNDAEVVENASPWFCARKYCAEVVAQRFCVDSQ